jgi:hypothetical protein
MKHVFRFETPDIAALAMRLSLSLRIAFEHYETACHGSAYYRGESEEGDWILQPEGDGANCLLYVESITGEWIAKQVLARESEARLIQTVRY